MNRLAVMAVALGALLVVAMTVYLWSRTTVEPGNVVAGTASEIELTQIVYVAEHHLYVVSTDEGFLALGDDSRHVGDRVLSCSLDGTFSSAHGKRFDLNGRYLAGPAQGDMARYRVTVEAGQVVVDISEDPDLPPRSVAGPSPDGPTPCGGREDPPGFYEAPTSLGSFRLNGLISGL